jgi:hypothetical protein
MMVLTLAAAVAGTTFDLNCSVGTVSGRLTGDLVKQLFDNKAPVKSEIYRIDLDRLRWCSGDCQTTEAIVDINAAEIVLYRGTMSNGSSELKLDRETGSISYILVDRTTMFSVLSLGKCEVAPFTGMPATRF